MGGLKYDYDPKYRRTAVSNEEIQEIFGKGLRLTGKLVGGIIKLPFKVVGKVVDIIIDDNEKVNPGNTVTIDEPRKYEEHSVKSEGELAKNQIQSSITTQSYASQSEYLQRLKELQTVTATQTITAVRTATLYPLRDVIRIYNFCSDDHVGDSDDYCRARKYSRFAAHSYPNEFAKDILPRNCEIIEKYVTDSGLRATLYNNNNEIICAFAGTKATSLKDWEANFTQVIGASRQYEDALEYGRDVCNRYPCHKVVFVGHSKGGGEAAYCAYNLGREAETFNPAGLSILTKYVGGEVRDDAIVNAYIFTTDILNLLQSAVGHGTIVGADGNIHYQPVANVFKYGIHGIKGILRYFKVKFSKP